MKTSFMKKVYYGISVAYILLGIFFYDWSIHMVPDAASASKAQIIFTVLSTLFYSVLGGLLLVVTNLMEKKKDVGRKLFSVIFWLALGSVVTEIIILKLILKIDAGIILYELLVRFILVIPAILMAVGKKQVT